MKTLLFVLGLLAACSGCEPSKLEIKDGKVDTAVKQTVEPPAEPVGVIPTDDCQQIDIGDKACNFTLYDQDGDVWELYDHHGDIILLDFSTIWCICLFPMLE